MNTKQQARVERGHITKAVLQAITEAHPKPLTSGQAEKLTGYTMNQVSAAMNKAGKQGYCHVHQSKKGGVLFGFASAEACAEYGFQQLAADETQIIRDRNVKHNARANRAIPQRPGVPANVVIAKPSRTAWAVREADASGAKVIVCPAPVSYSRTYVDPATRVVGGFATLGIGRYES